jgi:hypothetical protein
MKAKILRFLTAFWVVMGLTFAVSIADAPLCDLCVAYGEWNDPEWSFEVNGNCFAGSSWCGTMWQCRANGDEPCSFTICLTGLPPIGLCHSDMP